MQIKFLSGSRVGETADLPDTGATFGRDEGCNVVIDDEAASREHARLTHPGARYVISDLDSTNGVYVNDARIHDPKTVHPGDRIGIGATLFTIVGSGTDMQQTTGPVDVSGQPVEPPKPAPAPEPTGPREITTEGLGVVWLVLGIVVGLLVIGAIVVWVVYGARDDGLPPPPRPADTAAVELGTDPFAEPAKPADTRPDPFAPPPRTPAPAAPAPAIRVPRQFNILWLDSQPSGAAVKQGDRELGRTPLLLEDLEPGEHTYTLTLDGFISLDAKFQVPNDGSRQVAVLDQEPGTCRITSEPTGGAVFQGPQLLGRTPLVLRDMTPGEYPLVVRLPQYREANVTAAIDPQQPFAVNVALQPEFATVKLRTTPAGARVFVNDRDRGETRPAAGDGLVSQPLTVAGLPPGKVAVAIEYRGERSDVHQLDLPAGAVQDVQLTLWLPDTRIETRGGQTVDGMLLGRTDDGDVTLLLADGRERRIAAAEIADSLVLPLALGRELRAAARRQEQGGD